MLLRDCARPINQYTYTHTKDKADATHRFEYMRTFKLCQTKHYIKVILKACTVSACVKIMLKFMLTTGWLCLRVLTSLIQYRTLGLTPGGAHKVLPSVGPPRSLPTHLTYSLTDQGAYLPTCPPRRLPRPTHLLSHKGYEFAAHVELKSP